MKTVKTVNVSVEGKQVPAYAETDGTVLVWSEERRGYFTLAQLDEEQVKYVRMHARCKTPLTKIKI